jgi:hypothetical protein
MVTDPAHARLLETRKAVVSQWLKTADVLDAQGEMVLAGDVRQFARRLPPVLTDKEQLAVDFVRHLNAKKSPQTTDPNTTRVRTDDLAR